MDTYYEKYLKYKNKYIVLKKSLQYGGNVNDNIDFFFNYNAVKDQTIEKYDNFSNLFLVNGSIKKIGNPSENGFIDKLNFRNKIDSATFDCILKTSLSKDADNNFYEYTVGLCINKIKTFLPNFLYTFNYGNIKFDLKMLLKSSKEFTDLEKFSNDLELKNIKEKDILSYSNISNGCKTNDVSSIMLEYLPASVNFETLTKNKKFIDNYNIEIFNILFQVYAALSCLKNVYTHYDLHVGNVMFVEVPEDKTVLITYSINGKPYHLYTHFIPVIIDYGRSHINCLELDSIIFSKIFSEIACENPDCNTKSKPICNTVPNGLIINKNSNDNYDNQERFFYIDMRHKNESSDLRYLHTLMDFFKDGIQIKSEYNKRFDRKDWTLRDKNGRESLSYGVKENLSKYQFTQKISNTTDCINWLCDIYDKIDNSIISKKEKYGRMKIFTNLTLKLPWAFVKS
jgi:hypothetical protein